ncbi:MAG: polyprenyl synthetase family protein, partial [Cyanobacteria bacterium REEB65]|nr:polyprenyl synthetase family protein [Cyanobacteria bacterium REEB65]
MSHLEQGGKATRSRCVHLVGDTFGAEPGHRELARFAEAVELLHLGTLIHDDILDSAETRRGKSAVHVHYGPKVAVLAGDVAVSRSGRMIAEFDRTRLSRRFAEILAELCEGELLQDEQLWNPDLTLASYVDRVAKKTAGLF